MKTYLILIIFLIVSPMATANAGEADIEQPFTRRLSGIKIAEGIKEVTVRAHDSLHGYGGKAANVILP